MVNSPPPGPALRRPPRRFFAEDLLGGRVNLDGYPFRYICVTPSRSGMTGNVLAFGSSTMQLVDYVLSAIELLETHGWELVTIEQGGLLAYLRRR
jgi:hypothetical protein